MDRGAWWPTVHKVAKSWTWQVTEHAGMPQTSQWETFSLSFPQENSLQDEVRESLTASPKRPHSPLSLFFFFKFNIKHQTLVCTQLTWKHECTLSRRCLQADRADSGMQCYSQKGAKSVGRSVKGRYQKQTSPSMSSRDASLRVYGLWRTCIAPGSIKGSKQDQEFGVTHCSGAVSPGNLETPRDRDQE